VAFGHPDNKLSGPPKRVHFILNDLDPRDDRESGALKSRAASDPVAERMSVALFGWRHRLTAATAVVPKMLVKYRALFILDRPNNKRRSLRKCPFQNCSTVHLEHFQKFCSQPERLVILERRVGAAAPTLEIVPQNPTL
jgi:hypothetical protein